MAKNFRNMQSYLGAKLHASGLVRHEDKVLPAVTWRTEDARKCLVSLRVFRRDSELPLHSLWNVKIKVEVWLKDNFLGEVPFYVPHVDELKAQDEPLLSDDDDDLSVAKRKRAARRDDNNRIIHADVTDLVSPHLRDGGIFHLVVRDDLNLWMLKTNVVCNRQALRKHRVPVELASQCDTPVYFREKKPAKIRKTLSPAEGQAFAAAPVPAPLTQPVPMPKLLAIVSHQQPVAAWVWPCTTEELKKRTELMLQSAAHAAARHNNMACPTK